jgi:hypothetical protein
MNEAPGAVIDTETGLGYLRTVAFQLPLLRHGGLTWFHQAQRLRAVEDEQQGVTGIRGIKAG